jgi:hypothetical protein
VGFLIAFLSALLGIATSGGDGRGGEGGVTIDLSAPDPAAGGPLPRIYGARGRTGRWWCSTRAMAAAIPALSRRSAAGRRRT